MRIGVVIETEGGRAQVATSRRGPCGECADGAACSLPILPIPRADEVITVENRAGAAAGDTVELELPGHMELKLSFLVWSAPMVGLVGGAAAGAALHQSLGLSQDAATLAGAVAGFLGTLAGLRVIDRRAARDPRLVPRIRRVVQGGPDCDMPRAAPGD